MTLLINQVRSVLADAVNAYAGTPAERVLRGQLARLDSPLRVAIAGRIKAGKSTLLNALVGEEIAPTDAGECTKVVTWYHHAASPSIWLHPVAGPRRGLPIVRKDGALVIDLPAGEDVDRLSVGWPTESLRATTLIDTPGVVSLSEEVSARATEFLRAEDSPPEADAVIYLVRQLHTSDLRVLESFQARTTSRAAAVTTVAVLSRADEVGEGKLDALSTARTIARRLRSDPRLRPLCQTVLPLAGLLAQASRTLRQSDFVTVQALAAMSKVDVDKLMLSVDRFANATGPDAPPGPARELLLERLGLFGIRLAITLVRQGFADPPALAAELLRRSGLNDLRTVLATHFTEHADVLKSRSALLTLDAVLNAGPEPMSRTLRARTEQVVAGAHEFTELRLLTALRSGRSRLPENLVAEAERLLGAEGRAPWTRLGLPTKVHHGVVRDAALAALSRWRRVAESPLSARSTVTAAQVVIRTCESLATLRPSNGPNRRG
jgi:hypothetical protein